MEGSLRNAELSSYHENGFVIVRNVLSEKDLIPVQVACEKLIDNIAKRLFDQGKISSLQESYNFENRLARIAENVPEDEEVRNNYWGLDIMYARLSQVFKFFFNPNLLAAVESIVGSEITLSPIQHLRPYTPKRNSKQPFQVPWHQDLGVTFSDADKTNILTVWIPLVDVDKNNGCLQVIPVKENIRLIEHEYRYNQVGPGIKKQSMLTTKPVDCVMQRGDVLLMNALVPHRGQVNNSYRVRWSMDLRFQRTGTPTGREHHPKFIVKSKKHPDSVEDNYEEWCAQWIKALNAKNDLPNPRFKFVQD